MTSCPSAEVAAAAIGGTMGATAGISDALDTGVEAGI